MIVVYVTHVTSVNKPMNEKVNLRHVWLGQHSPSTGAEVHLRNAGGAGGQATNWQETALLMQRQLSWQGVYAGTMLLLL